MTALSLDQPYFERADAAENAVDRMLARGAGFVTRRLAPLQRHRLRGFARDVERTGPRFADLSDDGLLEAAGGLRSRLMRDGMTREAAIHAFALVREACTRQVGLRHFRVQLMGGAAMLRRCIAEMETGEGKTLTAVLPAATFALAGLPVHIVTVNEYLAERDWSMLRPVYEALGLSAGLVRHGQPPELRRQAYAADVTFCTNKDLVFDYLRDRLALGRHRARARQLVRSLAAEDVQAGTPPLLLRGLHVAIVDEADSILIDEARTPLILAGSDEQGEAVSDALYQQALELVGSLRPGVHWEHDSRGRQVTLTRMGREELERRSSGRTGIWVARRAREELAERALSALHLFHRDTQYIVEDEKVQIVDEFTGRVMPDRSWEFGLHQMIEAKEGVPVTRRKATLARMTFQRFFRRYRHLTGMTGTAAEVAGEIAATYRLGSIRVPTNRPSQRQAAGAQVFLHSEDRWAAVVDSAQRSLEAGRSVLIGTRSVETSERVSRLLTEAALPHVVLNARHDRQEAEIVAAAGQPGRITVATNMAGRGTDIRLARPVKEAGGLHVILTEYHESKRIDRQLFGRCGRQGDPGSYSCFAALDDELLSGFGPAGLQRAARWFAQGSRPAVHGRVAWLLVRGAQLTAGRLNARIRRETLLADRHLDTLLAFAGQRE